MSIWRMACSAFKSLSAFFFESASVILMPWQEKEQCAYDALGTEYSIRPIC